MLKSPVAPILSASSSMAAMTVNSVKNTGLTRQPGAAGKPVSGPARPSATTSNNMAVSVSAYAAPVGRTLARTMHLDVQNTPGSKIDKVADAIQRYLDIRPRNEPTADPLDEDSVARHPQQIIQSAERWRDELFYQFSANGLANLQQQPNFRAWGGRLEAQIENSGPAGIFAPASSAAPLSGENAYSDPSYAAANAVNNLRAHLSNASILEGVSIGVDAALDGPVEAGRNTMKQLKNSLVTPETQRLDFGPADISEKSIMNPVAAGPEAIVKFQKAIAPAPELKKVGPENFNEDPVRDPEQAWQEIIAATRERLEIVPLPKIKVGRPVYTEDIYTEPVRSGVTVTQVNVGLISEMLPERADSYKPRSLDEPYIRALRVISDLNAMTERMQIVGSKA